MSISRKNWESSKKRYSDLEKGLKRKTKKAKERAIEKFRVVICGYCKEQAGCLDCLFESKGLCVKPSGEYFFLLGALSEEDYDSALLSNEKILKMILDDEVNVYEEEQQND